MRQSRDRALGSPVLRDGSAIFESRTERDDREFRAERSDDDREGRYARETAPPRCRAARCHTASARRLRLLPRPHLRSVIARP
ncbi:hypothetical protein BRC90_08770 [Halobacteriales archaeon QS_4_69_34]|nr:MAG: hypothetical protein BRC90_08770 [Halobacteriales archaeon QS_4_69_34]